MKKSSSTRKPHHDEFELARSSDPPTTTARRWTGRLSCLSLFGLYTIACFASASLTAQTTATSKLAGTWEGVLEVGQGQRLRLVLHVQQEDDSLRATLDSPDQGATGIPVHEVTLNERRARFAFQTLGAVFEGTLAPDDQSIAGTWQQSGVALPLAVDKTKNESGLSSSR